MSRSRQLSPLPDDLPLAVRTLLGELRILKDRSGYDLRALATKTHASRSSWGRWLSGETWIPREAVASMAELCQGDPHELEALWRKADDERRSRQPADPAGGDGDAPPARTTTTTGRAPIVRGPILHVHPVSTGGLRPVRPRWGRTLFAGTVVTCAVVAGVVGLVSGMSLRKTSADPAPSHPYAQWVTRQEVLARVRTWHPHTAERIPYSQERFYQGYRTDGSGYASMAVGLPTPGPNSPDLASGQYTRRIPPGELRPGDLIINWTGDSGTREVAVFDAWADAGHTRYWVYQQRRGYGTDHLVLSYPLGEASQYHPYRPLNIHETGTARPSA